MLDYFYQFDLLFIYSIFCSIEDLDDFWDNEENYQLNEFRENFPDWDDD
jgi:hypothetical protein